MQPIFEYNSYKQYLKDVILAKENYRGLQARMAEAAGCQSSYLSQALSGKAELLPDHVLGIASLLEMTTLETEMLLTLLHSNRSTSKDYKTYLDKKIYELKESQKNLSEKINLKQAAKALESFYYTSWYWSAIHIATSIEELQSAEAISERLKLPVAKVKEALEKLLSYGLVTKEDQRWIYANGAAHLSSNSVMIELHHSHWRQKAILDVQKGESDPEETIHYTSVFTMSKDESKKVNELIVKFLKDSRKITDPSESEEIFCLNIDFFKP